MHRERHRAGFYAQRHGGRCEAVVTPKYRGRDRSRLARDRLDESLRPTANAGAIAERVDLRVVAAQGGGVDRNAAGVEHQAGAVRETARRLQAGGGNHLVGFEGLATRGRDADHAVAALDAGDLHAAHEAQRQTAPRVEQPLRRTRRQLRGERARLHVEQRHAVAFQRQVVCEFTADQAGADDHDVSPPRTERFAQTLITGQVVDAPAQLGGQGIGRSRLGAVRQHQMPVAQRAACRAQLPRGGDDADRVGGRHHAHAQALRGLCHGFTCELFWRDAANAGNRQRRLVVQVAGAGADERDRDVGIALAQRPRHLPTGAARADDHDARITAYGDRPRGAGRAARNRLRVIRFEVGLGDAAQRTRPVIGDIVETRAGGEAAVGIALGLVVDKAAGAADERAPHERDDDGAHAGITGALRRAISLRRCLIAGVTIATKCDSRTRRCTGVVIK